MDLTKTYDRQILRDAMRGGRYPNTPEQRVQIVDWLFAAMQEVRESGNHSVFGKLTNIWLSMDRINIESEEGGLASEPDKPQVVIVMPDNGRRIDG